jgi:ribosomal-protein-alanine N-acetyltransferase
MAVSNTEPTVSALPDWCEGLPQLEGERVTLRDLRLSDAAALYHTVRIPDVARQMWPPPQTLNAVERFIDRTQLKRRLGQYICFGVVPGGQTDIAGLFELRPLQPRFFRIELGYFLHPTWWGKGVFTEAARLVRDFSFSVLGAQRIEARVSVDNPRGNEALRKIGAHKEGRLSAAFVDDEGRYVDQYLWAIVNRGAAPQQPGHSGTPQ